MTNIQVWAFSGIAAVALAVGALMASGAVSSAQESSTTPTRAATTAPTTAASGSSGGTATPAPGKSDHNCPNMGSGSSTAATRSCSMTSGASGGI